MAPPSKKRKIGPVERVEEISFDPTARQDYLTGFHKRKQQRIKDARDAAVKREREEKIRDRAQMREQRKADVQKHYEEINEELRKQNPDNYGDVQEESSEEEDGWEGIQDAASAGAENGVEQDEEYVDEDKFTTVTVEAMELGKDDSADEAASRKAAEAGEAASAVDKKKRKDKTSDGKAKVKKRKFRYETKAERSVARSKQKAKNHAAKARRTAQ